MGQWCWSLGTLLGWCIHCTKISWYDHPFSSTGWTYISLVTTACVVLGGGAGAETLEANCVGAGDEAGRSKDPTIGDEAGAGEDPRTGENEGERIAREAPDTED